MQEGEKRGVGEFPAPVKPWEGQEVTEEPENLGKACR